MTDLASLYAQIPDARCKGLCQIQCSSAPCMPAEAQAMQDAGVALPGVTDRLVCTHLGKDGRCGIYEHRPMICRLFGAVQDLQCGHGCIPAGGFMEPARSMEIMRQVRELVPGIPYIPGFSEP